MASKLPPELIPIATRYRGPGVMVYPNRLDPPSTHDRMQELVDEGWLKKSVCHYDGEERHDVEQDEKGEWWCVDYGDPLPASNICTTYMTTDKTHDMHTAKAAIATRRMASVSEDLGELVGATQALAKDGLDPVFAKRCELAKLALDAPMSEGALDYYLGSMRKHR